MTKITEEEFARICEQIAADADVILKHNRIGTREETLLWMLLGVLISYLSLSEVETPCFTDVPVEKTYRQAILFILKNRKAHPFEPERYIDKMLS
ncbi:MAG: hypothetical protein D6735_13765 [Acidobacteria bacterium]|nr:MAG: hypothetical protein D6735_13765 [Acidobacteriota bacterium]